MKSTTVQLILFSVIAISSFAQQRTVSGTYVAYVKESKNHNCEVIGIFASFDTTKYKLGRDTARLFRFYKTCDGKEYLLNGKPYLEKGGWYYVSDSTVQIILPKKAVLEYKILLDKSIKTINGWGSGYVLTKEN